MSEESPHGATTVERLPPAMIEIVGQATLAVVATSDAHGECDSSLRAGPAGFLHVLDPGRVAYPEYRGNGVMASLGNLAENPHVGLLVVDLSGAHPNLHLGGSAEIVADDELRAEYPDLPVDAVPGRRTDTWVVVRVEDAAIQDDGSVPRLLPLPRDRPWGTDSPVPKGGDYFGAAASRPTPPSPGRTPAPPGRTPAPSGPTPAPSGRTLPTPGPTPPPAPSAVPAPGSDDTIEIMGSSRVPTSETPSPSDTSTRGEVAEGAAAERPAARTDAEVPRAREDHGVRGRGPGAAQGPPPSAGSRSRGLLVATVALAVLVVLLTAGLVTALVIGSGSSEDSSTAAPEGPTGPPTLYGRVIDVPDPGTVVVDVNGQPVTVSILGIDATTIPSCALPGAAAFARRTLERQMVTVVPDPTVAASPNRRGYVVTSNQSSFTDAAIVAGWATPSGTALYRPVFDEENRTARANEAGMFGPVCAP